MKFVDILQEVMVADAVICPHCGGTGLSGALTTYVNSGRTSVLKCDICRGTGVAHNTHEPDVGTIKKQMLLARYFHSQDTTKFQC
jgi:DnaJ-class molecular chaperone